MRADHQKDQTVIGSLGFSPTKGKGAGNGGNDLSCLCDEVSTKMQDSESFQVGGHIHTVGGRCSPAAQGRWLLYSGSSPSVSLYLTVHL